MEDREAVISVLNEFAPHEVDTKDPLYLRVPRSVLFAMLKAAFRLGKEQEK